MERAKDPAREVALIALSGGPPNDVLIEVIDYAFYQLSWAMSTPALHELLDDLRAKLAEEA